MRRTRVRAHTRRTKHGRTTVGAHTRNRVSEFEAGPGAAYVQRSVPAFPTPRNIALRKKKVAQAAALVRRTLRRPQTSPETILDELAENENTTPEAYAAGLLNGTRDIDNEADRTLRIYLREVAQLRDAEGRRQGRLFEPGPQGSRPHLVDPQQAQEFDRKFRTRLSPTPHPFVASMKGYDTYKAIETKKRERKAAEKAVAESWKTDLAMRHPVPVPSAAPRRTKSPDDLSPSIDEVQPGQRYWTKIGDELQEVEVVRVDHPALMPKGKQRKVWVKSLRTGTVLPKTRTASALRRRPESHLAGMLSPEAAGRALAAAPARHITLVERVNIHSPSGVSWYAFEGVPWAGSHTYNPQAAPLASGFTAQQAETNVRATPGPPIVAVHREPRR